MQKMTMSNHHCFCMARVAGLDKDILYAKIVKKGN
jgi:hypothetical protein